MLRQIATILNNDKWPMRIAGLAGGAFSVWFGLQGGALTQVAISCGIVGGVVIGALGLKSRRPLRGWRMWTVVGVLFVTLALMVGWVPFGAPMTCSLFSFGLLLLSFGEGAYARVDDEVITDGRKK